MFLLILPCPASIRESTYASLLFFFFFFQEDSRKVLATGDFSPFLLFLALFWEGIFLPGSVVTPSRLVGDRLLSF